MTNTIQKTKSDWVKKCILFLTGQTVSLLGSSLVQFTINWHITLTTKSGMMLTVATLCGFLPQVLVSLFAGTLADRFNRKRMIIFADAMIAVSTAVLAVLFTMGYEELWLLFVISAIRSVGAGIQMPAVSALIPDIVPEEKLLRVNGINTSIQSLMMIISPAAAGGLYGTLGLRIVFWIDVATAAIGIFLLVILKVKQKIPESTKQAHIFREMFDGIRYVINTKWLRQFLGFYLVYSLMLSPVVFLSPLMVTRSFGAESWRLMVHEMVFAVGMTIGGLIASIFAAKFRNKMRMVAVASVLFGLCTLIMGFSPNFWFYLAVILFLGSTMPFINTGAVTVLQMRVRPELMGRVFGLVTIIGSGAMPLSMAVFGPISDAVSVQSLLVFSGIFLTLIALVIFRFKEMLAAGVSQPATEESGTEVTEINPMDTVPIDID